MVDIKEGWSVQGRVGMTPEGAGASRLRGGAGVGVGVVREGMGRRSIRAVSRARGTTPASPLSRCRLIQLRVLYATPRLIPLMAIYAALE